MKRMIIVFTGLLSLAHMANMSAGSVQSIASVSSMQDVLQNNKLVVAEFYDSECGACQAYRRTGDFERAAKNFPEVKFVEVNMRKAQPVFSQYGAKRVPSILFFASGKQTDEQLGAPSASELDAKINRLKSNR